MPSLAWRFACTGSDHLPWLFLSERGQPLTRSSVQYLVRVAAERVGLLNVHPHTLRRSCGYYLADKGTDLRTMQDYLGHRDPRHTVHYTRLPAGALPFSPNRARFTADTSCWATLSEAITQS